jgi:rubredoxin
MHSSSGAPPPQCPEVSPSGLQAAALQLDRKKIVSTQTKTGQRWLCSSCGFIYDPAEGDPDGGIPPGTPFEEIPDDWFCPVCGARKADFEPYTD